MELVDAKHGHNNADKLHVGRLGQPRRDIVVHVPLCHSTRVGDDPVNRVYGHVRKVVIPRVLASNRRRD